MVADGDDLKVDRGSFFVCNRLYNEYNTGSVKMDNLQNTDQTNFIISINSFGKTNLLIARFSEQTFILMTILALGLSNIGKDSVVIVNILKLTTVKVFNK